MARLRALREGEPAFLRSVTVFSAIQRRVASLLHELATLASLASKESLMKLSARNAIPGTIESVTKGATTTTVKVDVGGGVRVTSSITNEAADDLALKAGDKVTAIIKSSDVIIGK
jgi:molybdopterin-binding protein